jgi:hypothetical protein
MTDPDVIPEPATSVAVMHGSTLDDTGRQALQTVRRALLASLHHGFITDLETHSRDGYTEWSWHRGTEEPEGIREGVLHTLSVIAPTDWTIR